MQTALCCKIKEGRGKWLIGVNKKHTLPFNCNSVRRLLMMIEARRHVSA